jgi:uncharacterized protein (DUF697 family)
MSHLDESATLDDATVVQESTAAEDALPKPRPRRRLYTSAPPAQPALPPAAAAWPEVVEAADPPVAAPGVAQSTLRAPTPPACSRSPLLRKLKSRQTIRDHALLAAGAMVIPLPFVDMAAEAAIQVRMVRRLAEIHGVDFAEKRARTLVAAAIGGFSAGLAAGTLLRYASFASYIANFWPSAAASSAITYGIGRLFEQHFEKGGHLDDLSPDTAARALTDNARRLRATLSARRTP